MKLFSRIIITITCLLTKSILEDIELLSLGLAFHFGIPSGEYLLIITPNKKFYYVISFPG